MRRLLILAALVGVTGPALAQQHSSTQSPAATPQPTPPAAASPATAGPVASYSDDVVVTASLRAEERNRVPATVTVIDAAEIADRQATEIGELLRTVPGLALARSGSPGKVTSLFSRGASSTQTLVLWNGLRLNDPLFGGYDWAFLPTEGVERVEVVRGPFSALYGGDAVGGVVQVLTGRGRGVGLRLEGGGDGYRRASAAAGFGERAWHLDVAGHVRRGDGEVANDFYDAEHGSARLTWEPRPGASVGLVARVAEAEVGVPFGFFFEPTPERTNRRRSRDLALPFRYGRADWEVEGHLGTSGGELTARDPRDPFAESATDAETLLGRTVLTYRPAGGDWWLAAGADAQEQRADYDSPFARLVDESQTTRATFAQAHWQSRRWTVQGGLRHDDSDRFGGETSARLGTVLALGGGARLRASYGEAFRAPTLSDLFFPFLGNPDLEPERSTSWEVGAEVEGGRWGASLVAFSSDFDNLIVFPPPVFQAENVGRARSRGLEGRLSLTAGSVSARLEATLLDAENLDTGEALARRPDESASLVVTWAPGRWTLAATGRYVGERPDLGTTLDAYSTVDLAAAWRLSPRAEPYLRLENALDEEYEEVAGFPAADRQLVGGVALRF